MNFLNTDFNGSGSQTEKLQPVDGPTVDDLREFYLSYRPLVSRTIVTGSGDGVLDPEALKAGKAGSLGTLALHTLILAERSVKNYTRNLLAYGVRTGMYAGTPSFSQLVDRYLTVLLSELDRDGTDARVCLSHLFPSRPSDTLPTASRTIWIRLGRSDSIINDRLSVHFYSVAFLAFVSRRPAF
jgi:hypothetical protein